MSMLVNEMIRTLQRTNIMRGRLRVLSKVFVFYFEQDKVLLIHVNTVTLRDHSSVM